MEGKREVRRLNAIDVIPATEAIGDE